MNEFLTMLSNDWHKIAVVVLASIHISRYIKKFIKPSKTVSDSAMPLSIVLPPKGCVITIKPIDD